MVTWTVLSTFVLRGVIETHPYIHLLEGEFDCPLIIVAYLQYNQSFDYRRENTCQNQMDITLNHPNGKIEFFPIEENTCFVSLEKHLKETYKCFNLVSNGVNIEDMNACFSSLEVMEVTVVLIYICDECSAQPEDEAMEYASEIGHLDCLKYLHSDDVLVMNMQYGMPQRMVTWTVSSIFISMVVIGVITRHGVQQKVDT